MSSKLQFSILPFIRIEDELQIGDVIIWPFYKGKDKYIKDKKLLNQLEKYLKQYVHYNKERDPLEVTIISYKQHDNFLPLTSNKINEIDRAIKSFFISNIVKNNELQARSANDFKFYHQNFIKDEYDLAIRSGSIVNKTDGGYTIDEILFIQPFNVSPERTINYDQKLLKSLSKLLKAKNKQRLKKRIFNSLDWVSYAYSNDDEFNNSSRIVMMATAFEFLFDGIKDKFDFMRKIGTLVQYSKENLKSHSSYRKIWKPGGKKIKEKHPFKEWWAYEFYNLRNKIVHGDLISSKSFRNRKGNIHFILSISFYEECLKRLLEQENLYNYDFIDKVKCGKLYDLI